MFDSIPAQIGDAGVIDPIMWDIDRKELQSYVEPGREMHLLQRAISDANEAHTIWKGQVPIVIFGYFTSTVIADVAYPWGIWSNAAEEHPVTHRRAMHMFLRGLLKQYGVLQNNVRADNTCALRWLHKVGAEVSTKPILSVRGTQMITYKIVR